MENNSEDLQEIISSKPFIGKSKLIDEDGLLSERIFGPQQNYKCKCGKLSTRSYDAGKRCPKCHVICGPNDLRLTTFAKITLPLGAIKPTKKRDFYKIVGKKNANLLNPIFADHSLNSKRYLSIQSDGIKIKIVNSLDPEPNWYHIPFRITGIYSFFLVLKYIGFNLNLPVAKSLFTNNYIMDYIKVLPPDIRPIIPTKNQPNKLRITEVNKHYESLINLNVINKNKNILGNLRHDEIVWLTKINDKFKNQIDMDKEIVEDVVMDYDSIAARYQYYVDKTYESVYSDICGKTGYIRSSILGKTIEFSARSVIRVDPSLPAYKIGVSKKILYKLWYPYYNYYMTNIKGIEYETFFENYTSKELYDKESFDEFLAWFMAQK